MAELEKIGRFEVLERIGMGSFAVAYKGRDSFSKELVAIKLCIAQDEKLRTGFLRLAETAGRLRHPSIARVIEFGSGDGKPYLVEEYVPGEHLGWRIERKQPIPIDKRLRFLVQIAEGLAYAHSHGVLHKNVAPRSIRLKDEEQVKISDFGIAQLASATARLADPDAVSNTDGYLAPEQALGLRPDARTDVFCFGALAYELLTYKKPFGGTTLSEMLDQTLRAPRVVDPSMKDLPEGMPELIRRCLRRDPAERYSDFNSLLKELRLVLEGSATGVGDATHPALDRTQAAPPEILPDAAALKAAGLEEKDWSAPPSDKVSTAYIVNPPDTPSVRRREVEELGDQTLAVDDLGDQTMVAEDFGDSTLMADVSQAASPAPEPPPLPKPPAQGSSPDLSASRPSAAAAEPEPPPLPGASAQAHPTEPPAAEPEPSPPAGSDAGKRPTPAPGRKGSRPWIWIAAAGLVLLAGLAFFLSGGEPAKEEPRAAVPPPAPAPRQPAPPPAMASLFVDARPWAELTRLVRPDGEEIPQPESFTPLHLELPPGTYLVELRHPDAEAAEVCEVELVAGASARCSADFKETDAQDYFRRSGWWR